ncbi:hypothetical protein HPB48_002406 [Haemaphysalis longicornis]|uniref:Uncharacterized protein n=1 Tax=Haemaphysalis longicornis TaxID=44386 RepID=A0A9J6GWL1_HAELO|nr:hypothetical protein HPB48_002406 [Haemaphysalis longicornis]
MTAVALIIAEHTTEYVLCPNSHQIIFAISTPRRENADRYRTIELIDFRGTTHEICTYKAATLSTVKGVIRDKALEDRPQEIQEQVVQDHYMALQAKSIGRSVCGYRFCGAKCVR